MIAEPVNTRVTPMRPGSPLGIGVYTQLGNGGAHTRYFWPSALFLLDGIRDGHELVREVVQIQSELALSN